MAALVLGAGVATGAYAVIDNGDASTASKVIVVESPAPNTADIPGKNESTTASAIAPPSAAEIPGKNEATTAGAIAPPSGAEIPGKDESKTAAGISQSSGVDLRGSKASSSGTSSEDAAEAQRTDPHGPAVSLRNP